MARPQPNALHTLLGCLSLLGVGTVFACCCGGCMVSWFESDMSRADKLYAQGKQADAVSLYKKAVRQDNDRSAQLVALIRIVRFEFDQGNRDEARAWIEVGLKHDVVVTFDDPAQQRFVNDVRAAYEAKVAAEAKEREERAAVERKEEEREAAENKPVADRRDPQPADPPGRPKAADAPANPAVTVPPHEVVEFTYKKGLGGGTIRALATGDLTEANLLALLDELAKRVAAERAERGERWLGMVAVFVYSDRDRLADGGTWVARLLSMPGEPPKKEVNRDLLAELGKPPAVRCGLTEDQRKALFREYVWVEDWFTSKDPGASKAVMGPAKDALAAKHGLTREQLQDIVREGVEQEWPLPDDPPAGWKPPEKVVLPAKKPTPKQESNAVAEQQAADHLRFAKAMIKANRLSTAKEHLQTILKEFPKTRAATEAAELLKTLK